MTKTYHKSMTTDSNVTCQWCESDDTYTSGYSPVCIETQYKCRECDGETWE